MKVRPIAAQMMAACHNRFESDTSKNTFHHAFKALRDSTPDGPDALLHQGLFILAKEGRSWFTKIPYKPPPTTARTSRRTILLHVFWALADSSKTRQHMYEMCAKYQLSKKLLRDPQDQWARAVNNVLVEFFTESGYPDDYYAAFHDQSVRATSAGLPSLGKRR